MTDKPILFSAPMIRALLDGRKTQTRRVLKPQPDDLYEGQVPRQLHVAIGDRLWVREAHYLTDDGDNEYAVYAADEDDVRAHNTKLQRMGSTIDEALWRQHAKLRPSIHMPRWASRLTLIVTDVRVQRLQEISEEDATAEGWGGWLDSQTSDGFDGNGPRTWFHKLWDSINGPDAWDRNDWVVAYTFTVHRCNIDALAKEPQP